MTSTQTGEISDPVRHLLAVQHSSFHHNFCSHKTTLQEEEPDIADELSHAPMVLKRIRGLVRGMIVRAAKDQGGSHDVVGAVEFDSCHSFPPHRC